MTTEEFIAKAKAVHGDKYDYTKVVYKGSHTKVCIICPEHGEFWQEARMHLKGQGCRKCIGNIKLTTEEFIRKAKSIHGDKYDYSKVEYVNNKTKVCIICPEHGEFYQAPSSHIQQGQGCPKCGKPNIYLKREEWIRKAIDVHGDKYDYNSVVYNGTKMKLCIICPEHGEFWQEARLHLKGFGCPRCSGLDKKTTEEFIRKAKSIHGDKYDYSKVEYVNRRTKVCIICPEHGEFWQNAGNHIGGSGCPRCIRPNVNMTTEEFIAKAREAHGDKYSYSKVEYVNSSTKVCIICPEHGEFWQRPDCHLRGQGCPICNRGYDSTYKFNLLEEFMSEYELKAFLMNNDVNILLAIMSNINPKYEPIKKDIVNALQQADMTDPIHALQEKYSDDNSDTVDIDTDIENNETFDLDNDEIDDENIEASNETISKDPEISDIIPEMRSRELAVIDRIEHQITPEILEYILYKFRNDNLRNYMGNGENLKNI